MKIIKSFLLLFLLLLSFNSIAQQSDNPLIPRRILFGNPDKASPSLSPDGQRIAFLAPIKKVLNVWVADISDFNNAKPVTHEAKRDILSYSWTNDGKYIIYEQDHNGDENYHLFRVNLANWTISDLTPFPKIQAQAIKSSLKYPQELLVGLNNRDARWHDVYRLNIATGKLKLVEKNNRFGGYTADDELHLRIADKPLSDGGSEVYFKDKKGKWVLKEKIPFEDVMTTSYLGFDRAGKIIYKVDSKNRDKAAFFSYDPDNGTQKLLAESDKADVTGFVFHPTEFTPQVYGYNYEKVVWNVLDKRLIKDYAYLRAQSLAEFAVTDRALADDKWLIRYYSDVKPSRYYLYERDPKNNEPKKLSYLFTTSKELDKQQFAPMRPVIIKARDGLEMVSYLTEPMTPGPHPLVLSVHGGPWARDSWGLDIEAQWLVNRGYAVLSVNYRGSTGFGKSFVNAGNMEWSGKMHSDLIDAVNWAIENKIADPKKIAICGGSYGGYAALVGLTFTPDIFNSGVSIVGPSNLVTLIRTIPPYWKPAIAQFKLRVGDIDTKKGRALLRSRSPLTFAKRIKKPLLILQGEHDPRVKKAEAEQIVNSMRKNKIPVTYVLYHDEGHGFVRQPNQISSNAIVEQFFAENLGGRSESIKDDFQGANFSILSGQGLIKAVNTVH